MTCANYSANLAKFAPQDDGFTLLGGRGSVDTLSTVSTLWLIDFPKKRDTWFTILC